MISARQATIQLCLTLQEEDLWMTAFTDVILDLLAVDSSVSLQSDSETIEQLLLDVKDIEFKYNVNKKVITEIMSVST